MGIDEIADKIRERLSTSNFGSSVKFDCGTDGAILINGRTVTMDNASADCVIQLTKDDLEAMIGGELDPTTAFMQGRLRVDGDLSVAMQLSQAI